MLDEFTKQTGIAVNVVFAKKGMVEKIKAAGANNPADAVLTVDVGRLDALHKAGLLEPVDSAILDETIPRICAIPRASGSVSPPGHASPSCPGIA